MLRVASPLGGRYVLMEIKNMGMIPTYEELKGLSREEIIERYNQIGKHTVVGTQFYLDELIRRQNEEQTNAMLKINKRMQYMTVLITILTIANVVLVAMSV
ncbi:hypothetical protein ACPDME_003489 [Vibrio cholerae]